MSKVESKQAIMADPRNKEYTERDRTTLCSRRQLIIEYHRTSSRDEDGRSWYLLEDKSGDRLREWLGVDEDTFYNSGFVCGHIPMDFIPQGMGIW